MRYLSLFSGIEACSVAWEPLGWQPVAFADIEPFPCALLAHRFPHVPNLGDVTKITEEQIAALGPIDVVVGGSPCQDLSVAGKRAGLAGARSSLFHEQGRIFDAARARCGARWLVWENVPGAFSTHAGRDFARVVGDLAGCELAAPADGWCGEGVALGDCGLVEWAVLDAQWFGVAQRRRRVFAVLDTGNWRDRPPVLLEPESLRGDHPPRREAREGIAGGTLRSTLGGSDVDHARAEHLVAGTLGASHGNIKADDAWKGSLVTAHALDAFSAGRATEDWTGRGCPLVPEVAPTMRAGGNRTGGDRPPGTDVDTCESLVPEIVPQAMSSKWSKGTSGPAGDECANLVPVVLFDERTVTSPENRSACNPDAAVPTMHEKPFAVATSMSVRRLTPRECERLQGFPDDWTAIPYRGKVAADGPRYRALGNSMAVPCMAWIGRQIERAHSWGSVA